jgi:tetratricopeptide (TPR) repeat protein
MGTIYLAHVSFARFAVIGYDAGDAGGTPVLPREEYRIVPTETVGTIRKRVRIVRKTYGHSMNIAVHDMPRTSRISSAIGRCLVGDGLDIGGSPDFWDGQRDQFPGLVKVLARDRGEAGVLADLAEASFDFVYSEQGLARVGDPGAALRRWLALLKPDGHLIGWAAAANGTGTSGSPWRFSLVEDAVPPDGVLNLLDLVRQLGPLAELRRIEVAESRFPGDDDAIEFVIRKRSSATPLPPLAEVLALHRGGRAEEAEIGYRRWVRADPDNPEAWYLWGRLALAQGRSEWAEPRIRRALALAPDVAAHHYGLGRVLAVREQWPEAERAFRDALALAPEHGRAELGLARALLAQDRPDEAEIHCRRALARLPEYPSGRMLLGEILAGQGAFAEAEAIFGALLREVPPADTVLHVHLHNQLGVLYNRTGRWSPAIGHYRQGLALAPDNETLTNGLGLAYLNAGQPEAAVEWLSRALERNPEHPWFHHNRALARLYLGDYPEGFAEYEWRFRCPTYPEAESWKRLDGPCWAGEPLAGRRLLVWSEQGFGDILQFLRFLYPLAERGARLTFACTQPSLVPLLRAALPVVERVLAPGDALPDYDFHFPLLSLPLALGVTLETLPAATPYLHPPQEVREWARDALRAVPGYKVGIVWRGRGTHHKDLLRSIPLACFRPLAEVPGVTLVSLQQWEGRQELATADFPVVEVGEPERSFLETAALMTQLDRVVTIDSAPVHLAGALGVPAWLALYAGGEWRWLKDREDSPWYPGVRIFRQRAALDWAPVFEEMVAGLRGRDDG